MAEPGTAAAAGLGVFMRFGVENMTQAIRACELGTATSTQQQMVVTLVRALCENL